MGVANSAATNSNQSGKFSSFDTCNACSRVYIAILPASPALDENISKVNGVSIPATVPTSPLVGSDKSNKKKITKKDEVHGKPREDITNGHPASDRAGTPLSTAASRPLPRSSAPSPAPSTSAAPNEHTDLTSPTDSAGARTPLTNRPRRNPNTLFVNHLPTNVSEEEIRQFFGAAAEGVSRLNRRIIGWFLNGLSDQITSIKIPHQYGRQPPKLVAFVEFGDKEAMEAGLAGHRDVRVYLQSSGWFLTDLANRHWAIHIPK